MAGGFSLFGGGGSSDHPAADAVAVIGLGRFGASLALELVEEGTEVLGIDSRPEVVQELENRLTHVVQADSTDAEALRQLSVPDFDRVVVGIGSDLLGSILTCSNLVRFGMRHIWAKAVSDAHGEILDQLGVQHIVYPERDMGRRVAHLVRWSMLDFIQIDPDFALVKTTPPATITGVPLGRTNLRERYGVTVVAVRPAGRPWTNASAETVLAGDEPILVSGPVHRAEAFSALAGSRGS